MRTPGLPDNPATTDRTRRFALPAAALVVLVIGLGIIALTMRHHSPSPPPPTPPNPPVSPGREIDLSGWKLSLPEQNAKGDAASIEPATTKAPWLTRTADGELEFWAPTTGATTKNSDHPRTELQSRTYFPAGKARHTLTASVTPLQLPQDGRGVILGQIHGAGDISSAPYVMLRLQNEKLRVVVKQVQDGDDLINYPLLDGVGLNTRIAYTITDQGNGDMTFSASANGVSQEASAPVPAEFRGATVRFQAGDYQQANTPGGPEDGARVIFHVLDQR